MTRIGTLDARGAKRIGSAVRCVVMAVLALSIDAAGPHRAAADWFFPTLRLGRADIAGRWVLRTPTRTYCVVDFSGSPDTAYGSITVTGFCPWPFLGRPRWRYQDGHVLLQDRRGIVVADLIVGGRNLLGGETATGEPVWFNR